MPDPALPETYNKLPDPLKQALAKSRQEYVKGWPGRPFVNYINDLDSGGYLAVIRDVYAHCTKELKLWLFIQVISGGRENGKRDRRCSAPGGSIAPDGPGDHRFDLLLAGAAGPSGAIKSGWRRCDCARDHASSQTVSCPAHRPVRVACRKLRSRCQRGWRSAVCARRSASCNRLRR